MNSFNNIPRFGLQVPLAIAGIAGAAGATASTAIGIGSLAAASGIGGGGGGNKIQAPAARNYLGEMQSALNAQAGIQDQLINQQNQYMPQYQQMQQTALMNQMGNVNAQYQAAMPQSFALQNQYAQGMNSVYGNVGQTAQNAYAQTMNPQYAGLQASMLGTVQNQLNAGTGLTDQMTQQAQQSARAAMSARGLTGNQAIGQEVLNSYNLGQTRQQQALTNASALYGQGMQQANSAMASYGSPLMASMGGMGATGLIGTAGAQNASLNQNMLFTPESQYNAGIYGANQSNAMQTQLANQQAQAGWSSGMMGMVGNLGGAYLKNTNLVGNPTASDTYNPNWMNDPNLAP